MKKTNWNKGWEFTLAKNLDAYNLDGITKCSEARARRSVFTNTATGSASTCLTTGRSHSRRTATPTRLSEHAIKRTFTAI